MQIMHDMHLCGPVVGRLTSSEKSAEHHPGGEADGGTELGVSRGLQRLLYKPELHATACGAVVVQFRGLINSDVGRVLLIGNVKG